MRNGVETMSEYQVQVIEDEAKTTRKSLFGKGKTKKETITLTTDQMVHYCDKVIFLCRMIRKLKNQ